MAKPLGTRSRVKVGIIGAGIAGLAAARTLKAAGLNPVIFEKSHTVGGRCATRTVDGFVFDSGATSIAPGDAALGKVMLEELDTAELVEVPKPIFVHHGLRPSAGDPKRNRPRYTYRNGMVTLPRLLAAELDVRLKHSVERIERRDNAFAMHLEGGEEHVFDHIVLTPPIPQTAQLLWTAGESRPFANVRYRACLSILLGYELPPPDVAYHALLDPDQRHPMTWVSLESVKCPSRPKVGGTAIVAQMSPAYSIQHYATDPQTIIRDVSAYIAQLYGEAWRTPAVSDVKVWKYSQPETVARLESVNRRQSDSPLDNLWVASDGVASPRVEGAYEAGFQVARAILETVSTV